MDEEEKKGEEGEGYKKEEGEGYSKPEESPKPSVESHEPAKPREGLADKLFRENPFIPSTLVLGILVILLLIIMASGGGITGKAVSSDVAGENLVEYLNNVADSEVTLIDVEDTGDFYLATIEFKEQEMPIYITKDGAYYTSNLIPLVNSEDEGDEPLQEIAKSDKPVVELFIMTHCPYGTQAEKGMIPVMEALGDKADIQIRFVHYYMHEPEEEETLRQVCIREEQSEKWIDYLRCFLEDGDADRCLTETGINQGELSECISNNAEGYYAGDSDLSEDYGVQGSPTLIINGQIVSSARSPAAYLDTICQAFNDVPPECELELDTANPSPMWGWDASGADTTAQC